MNDEEIIKTWNEIHRQEYIGQLHLVTYEGDKKVAIRLYRQAEDQARADEREKMKKNGSLLYLETEVQELILQGKAHAEQQYTEGYLAGQRSKTAYDLGKGDGLKAIMDTCEGCRRVQYKRGQTDLIEKLTGEYGRGQICDGCIHAIQGASESFGNVVASRKPETKVKPKTAKPENAHENGKSIAECGCKDCNKYKKELSR